MTAVVFNGNKHRVFEKAPEEFQGSVMCLIGPTMNKWYSWYDGKWRQIDRVHPRYLSMVKTMSLVMGIENRLPATVVYPSKKYPSLSMDSYYSHNPKTPVGPTRHPKFKVFR